MNNADQKLFFQKCLYEALIICMKRLPFEQISISELCETAGVSRMTFYRSYRKKEEILLQHLDNCFNEYIDRLRSYEKAVSYDIAYSFFEYWCGQEGEFLTLTVSNGLSDILVQKFCVYLETVIRFMFPGMQPKPFILSFLAGGLYQILIDWIKEDKQTPIDEIAKVLHEWSLAITSIPS